MILASAARLVRETSAAARCMRSRATPVMEKARETAMPRMNSSTTSTKPACTRCRSPIVASERRSTIMSAASARTRTSRDTAPIRQSSANRNAEMTMTSITPVTTCRNCQTSHISASTIVVVSTLAISPSRVRLKYPMGERLRRAPIRIRSSAIATKPRGLMRVVMYQRQAICPMAPTRSMAVIPQTVAAETSS